MADQTWQNVRRTPSRADFPSAGLNPPERPLPDLSKPAKSKTFEVGLVLAGAVSAGAYIGGVLDFLIEALDAWEEAKAKETDPNPRNWSVPGHDVVLPVITGTSGGGISAAIAATALWRTFPHVRSVTAPGATGNPFFDAWVNDIDVRDLLGLRDLTGDPPQVPSVLDSTRLDEIVERTLATPGGAERLERAYAADPLRVLITFSNLRGVPYWMRFDGNAPQGHGMMLHRDHLRFFLRGLPGAARRGPDTRRTYADEIELPFNPPPSPAVEAWRLLGQAALATSAFPAVFKPRQVSRPYADYDHRVAAEEPGCAPDDYYAVSPSTLGDTYACLAVDGGTMDNEPLELARGVLAGRFGRNPRGGTEAVRATVLVDPFPEMPALGPETETGVNPITTALGLVGAWTNQARFRPDDIALAHDETVYSRFLLAPDRGEPPTGPARGYSLASSVLGGFGAFLSWHYRVHDYLLGRRNCQQFLQRHFMLDARHPMFADHWNPALTAPRRDGGYGDDGNGTRPPHLPIIPVIRGTDVDREEPRPAWPSGRYDPASLAGMVDGRFEALWFATLDNLDVGWFARTYLGPVRRRAQKRLKKAIVEKLAEELRIRGL